MLTFALIGTMLAGQQIRIGINYVGTLKPYTSPVLLFFENRATYLHLIMAVLSTVAVSLCGQLDAQTKIDITTKL